MIKTAFHHALRWVPAIILLQTLFFKFSAHPVSVHIFSTLNIEPWGRIMTGILELIAGVMLIVPAFSGLGALLSVGLMAGAISSHLMFLGIEVLGDGGQLFAMAVMVFLLSLEVSRQEKETIVAFVKKFTK
jgi:uncharacterized membrane protein YphA (DoxX/SURF4 family)